MGTLYLPRPEDPNNQRAEGDGLGNEGAAPKNNGKRQRKKSQIPDVDACLRALSVIPGLLAMHVITPSHANSMVRVYSTILQHHQGQQRAGTQHVLSSDAIKSLLQKDPTMMSILEPLLTDEQINLILKEVKESPKE